LISGYVNLNHGSFGSTPRVVLEAQRAFTQQMEAMPDPWFRAGTDGYRQLVVEARQMMADYMNVTDPADLTIVENASSGVNAVFRSMKFNAGDKILITSTAYSMVKNLCHYLGERYGVITVTVQLVFPLTSNDDILRPVAAAIAEHGSSIKLASFSHIDSVPGFILPASELVRLCRASGIRTFIDGAHAIGQIPINIAEMDPDYYVTNAHKWLYTPRGCSPFYVRKEFQAEVSPTVVSSEWSSGQFLANFAYTGTRDYTPFVSLRAALQFRESMGGDAAIHAYLRNLSWFAGTHLAAKWGTATIVPQFMIGAMIDVELPVVDMAEGEALRHAIFEEYNMYFITHQLQGRVFTRLSAQIYLEQADFVLFGERVLETLARLRAAKK